MLALLWLTQLACSSGAQPGLAAGGAGSPASAGALAVGGAQDFGVGGVGGAGGPGSAGGAVASGNSAGADSGSGGAVASGGASAGVGGRGGSAGASAAAGAANSDTPAPRPLNISAAAARHEHTFLAHDADATVTFNDKSQIAVVDNRAAKMVGKLVLPFQGQGTTAGSLGDAGEFAAHRGFHVLAIAAFQNYNIVIGDPKFYGDARKEVFEGIEYTHTGDFAQVSLTPADGVAVRTQKGLQYLAQKFPTEDWGYYLNADGSVRWSDVIFEGVSHGASNAARFAMLVRVSRVVSLSGPRDNACTSMNAANCGGVVADWLSEVPKTPIDRFYAITGVSDDQHLQHLFAMQLMKYVGNATDVIGAQPPYGGSHRLQASAGHGDYCGKAAYQAACNYLFGVPSENANATP